MDVSLRLVLTAQGVIASSVTPSQYATSTRIDCANLCFNSKSCSALFYDPGSTACFLCDERQHVTEMVRTSNDVQYFEVQSDYCDNEYTYIRSMNLCYKVSTIRRTWLTAKDNCASEGAHLIKLESATVNNFIFALAKREGLNLWVGVERVARDIQWLDGSSVTPGFWSSGHPSYYDTYFFYGLFRWYCRS